MELASFIEARLAAFLASLADPGQRWALAAAAIGGALIVASTLVKTIIPLRWLALGGNMGFVVYGLMHPAPLVFLLHVVLLPINLWRVLEMQRLTRRLRHANSLGPEELKVWLQPFMKRRRLRSGTVLFRQGDRADRLYLLAEGRLEVVEAGRAIEAGQMFGEIAFFSPGQRRTATVRCVEPSTVLSIDEVSVRQLFFQNPGFGFEVARLIAGRLSEDISRLQRVDPVPPLPGGDDAAPAPARASRTRVSGSAR